MAEGQGYELPVGIVGVATYLPPRVVRAAEIAQATGLPEEVVRTKMGLEEKRVAGPEDGITAMAVKAARRLLEGVGLEPERLNLVIYHGSEYKDYIVWSAATRIQHLLGATGAYAFELYGMCAGGLQALKVARDMMRQDASLEHVLLVSASREGDLVAYTNPRARFMFNFGAGASAMLLRRDHPYNQILESAFITDGSFSMDVIMPAGGTEHPASAETVAAGLHHLDVPDPAAMKERLDPVSLPNFLAVIRQAVERSGRRPEEVRFLGLNHMKRSFHERILRDAGLDPAQSVYLSRYGHIQSVDAALALELGLQEGRIHDGDLVVLAAAGTGYTWGATCLQWGQDRGR